MINNLLLLFFAASQLHCCSSAGETFLHLEHSVDGGASWSPRNSLKVSPRGRANKYVDLGSYEFEVEQVAAFEDLVASSGFYMVRAKADASNDASAYVMASVRACVLHAEAYEEFFTVALSPAGLVNSLTFVPKSHVCPPAATATNGQSSIKGKKGTGGGNGGGGLELATKVRVSKSSLWRTSTCRPAWCLPAAARLRQRRTRRPWMTPWGLTASPPRPRGSLSS